MSVVLPFVLSLVVGMSLLPLLARVAGRLHLVDAPAARKVHAEPIPRVGGIAIAVGVLAAVTSVEFSLTTGDAMFLAGAVVIFVFGVLDDRYDVDYRIKFAGQIVACALPVVVGGAWVGSLELPMHIELPRLVGIALTMFYMVGVTNAVNLSDGLDGLAGGTTFLCLCALAWLAYLSGNPTSVGLCLAFAGGVLGFLRFNTYPAIVFMGDAGSQLLGYAIGGLGLLATQGGRTPFSPALPVLLLGVPILDTIQVMVRRVAAGASPFRADKGHLHHRLLALGFEHHEAVMMVYLVQAMLLGVAYLERFETDLVIILTFVAYATAVLASFWIAERSGWRLRAVAPGLRSTSGVVRFVDRAYTSGGLIRVAVTVVGLGLLFYGAATLYQAGDPPEDFMVAAWLLAFATLVILAVRRGTEFALAEKAVLYAVVAAFVFTDVSVEIADRRIPHLDWALMMIVAVATVVSLRSMPDRRFRVTPLDLLILFATLVLPNLPDLASMTGISPLAIAKLVVLFYALEVIVMAPGVRPVWVRAGACLAAVGMAVNFLVAAQ